MAKNRTSQQEDLTSKTGINVMSDLGFSKPAPVKPAEQATIKNVDKLADDKPASEQKSAKLSQDSTNTQTADKPEKPAPVATAKAPLTGKKTKLQRPADPNRQEETCKISAIISVEAKANLEKYAKLYGYKKLSPFLNDILERLDLYMDE